MPNLTEKLKKYGGRKIGIPKDDRTPEIEKSLITNGKNAVSRCMDQTWTMRKEDIKDRRSSKCEYGEEWKNSVGLNKSQIKKY